MLLIPMDDLHRNAFLRVDRGRHGATFDVINPATERVVSVCSKAGDEDVDEAVKAARKWYVSSVLSSPRLRLRHAWRLGVWYHYCVFLTCRP